MNYLVVVDMQTDFITGSLGSDMAVAILPRVEEKIKSFDGEVIFTCDTHEKDYLETQEGRKLPVPHCIKNTDGWQIARELRPYVKTVVDKATFGSVDLPNLMREHSDRVEKITLCGLCTDICVISNVMITKALFPEVPVIVDAKGCAGVTPESHKNALAAMKMCQVTVINE